MNRSLAKYLLADLMVFFAAYCVAFLLRFDFQTPPCGWKLVFIGSFSTLIIGALSRFILGKARYQWRTITLHALPRFLFAIIAMVIVQLALRFYFNDPAFIYLRPPISVTCIEASLSLLGLLSLRYLSRLQLRPVQIADLLGRQETPPQVQASIVAGYAGKRVLITGAGGSIGSELARQVFNAKPERLILLDISERSLYEIYTPLSELSHAECLRPVVADCADRVLIAQLLKSESPDIILHAAAYKHVPLMELNVAESIANNSLATRLLAEEAQLAHVKNFVLISTDKAIRPISAMGLSKRLAELFITDLSTDSQTRFSAVRFGNVLDSSGSVVPRFREQIRQGGPVTLTDERMERYFMTIPEAAGLVLQASTCTQGGEIFVLDMGKPIKIRDLAESMIRLSGLRPNKDIAITVTGIRPGEKLSEELGVAATNALKTEHARIFIGQFQRIPHDEVMLLLALCQTLVSKKVNLTKSDLAPLFNHKGVIQ